MTSANQPHYEDSPPVTVQSAPTMPTAASAQYRSSSHNALRTLGFALLAASASIGTGRNRMLYVSQSRRLQSRRRHPAAG